ncbi:hypothetical protein BAUCODRAFT_84039 [Baudoinia panamericana UAMH 10762]|uniref:SAGA complex subunit Spt7 n=1 Tax=Baudoinia panamericana (strain UAMH 10762) TaxID=717646 RepID=M2LZW8_BAUPA|nr:uncharacterized protein BAUCODRAFT_84039 [Baudoinia panamericana UAMH 10762]EMD00268.1 hypothetical protein BAUCODRAFT_84039 [Baudoinia panamericana UAMH 10762]
MTSTPQRGLSNGYPSRPLPNGLHTPLSRRQASLTRNGAVIGGGLGAASAAGEDEEREEDATHALLGQRWADAEERIATLFDRDGRILKRRKKAASLTAINGPAVAAESAKTSAPPKKAARQVDDDYGDSDDEDEDSIAEKDTPLKAKGKAALANGLLPHAVQSPAPAVQLTAVRSNTTLSSGHAKSSEEVRKQLEEDKKAAADAAKRSFQTMFYTWENDRDAMLEQQKLDELDREVENETSAGNDGTGAGASSVANHGTLGSADLGASSLTLKHLIARIDAKRHLVQASDNQLRTLISEVRKGRSKWASEDRVGQEELYEAAEKVLMELKAQTEYAQPFLNRVIKRDAPDYFQIIKHPMDIGTMLKKLKTMAYKSKREFVDDLNLIWSNCLKYNSNPDHPFRKKALYMRKETDKLTQLIPEITVRDRAEVEAEERKMNMADADESDEEDDAPLASRGRKAPKKGVKGAPSSARKAPSVAVDETDSPAPPDVKPLMHASTSHLRNEFLRADSETQDASSAGFSTPPPGTATPLVNGVHGVGSQPDVMEVDGFGGQQSVLNAPQDDPDEDDTEFKTWKQVTKKDRAIAATERNRLFQGERGERLNIDEPALLRSKAAMRRWMRQQKMLQSQKGDAESDAHDDADAADSSALTGETLAEGIEKDEDSTLPDYYNPLSAIPNLQERWMWTTDSAGHAIQQSEKWLRMHPRERFVSSSSSGGTGGSILTRKMEANMRQMQETRKVCSKISLVKQMQLQGQTYQNQFQRYEPQPFVEQDIGTVVVSEEGPLIAPWLNRAALQRSVGKIFYHAGFEDFQPSALDAAVDLAGEYFGKLVEGFKVYREQPKRMVEGEKAVGKFSFEEQVLHTLQEGGLDLENLEGYVKDEVDRLGTKLGVVHERMKGHLADLLRPALGDHAGADGVGAFQDGSEQFVGGDFAEDLDEDFFGFRELGLAAEFGLENLSVPLHLLQNRMQSAFQAQHQGPTTSTGLIFPPPEPYEAISSENLGEMVGIAQDFFRARLRTAGVKGDEGVVRLVEDEELPLKQRFPKPRLPPTGKISSPRKRPIREQQQAAKKKRKLDVEGRAEVRLGGLGKPVGALKLKMPPENGVVEEPGKGETGTAAAMISPESIAGN